MSAPDQIRERLEAATIFHPVPHRAVINTAGDRHGVVDSSGSVVTMDPPAAAAFYANAPTDIAHLLGIVDQVESLAKYLDGLAPGDQHYAKLIRAAITGGAE